MKRLLLLLIALCLCGTPTSAQRLGQLYIVGRHPGSFALSGGCTPSISGTREPTPSSTITDSACNVWTMGTGTTPTIQILVNGVQVDGTYVGAQILYYNGVVYIQGDDLSWYSWTGGIYTGGVGPADPQTGALPDPGTACDNTLTTAIVPCAYGPGMSTRAAYGDVSNPTPAIYHITSLLDDGSSGTLRYAMEHSGARVIIFERSGYIDLGSEIVVDDPYMTVAGQTAPSPGITLRYHGVQIRTHDVLMQHVRIRPGWTGANCNDALGTYPAASNVVFDHMSVSWGQDENVYLYTGLSGGDANVTFWRSITAESLHRTPGSSACTGSLEDGHGFLITQNTLGVGIIQSVFAHNFVRNPYGQNNTGVTLLNNVIYDWSRENGIDFECYTALGANPWYVTAVGNRFIRGPNTTTGGTAYRFFYYCDYAELGNRIYRSDNTLTNDNGSVSDEDNLLSYDPNTASVPALAPIPSGYVAIASTALEAFLLSRVGARPADRDSADARILSEVHLRTGGAYPETQTDVGGFPTLSGATRSLTEPTSPHATGTSGFYTRLEEWLAGYAAAVESPTAP